MKAKIYTNDFNRIIAATKDFVSKNSNKKTHTYIRLEFRHEEQRVTAIAVDGYRMSVENSVCECDEDFNAYIRSNVKLPSGLNAIFEIQDGEVIIRCGDFIFGYQQPEGEFLDWKKVLPDAPTFKVGFNGNYLLTALNAAKVSAGNSFKHPIVLEFRGPLEPVIIRTNKDDVKMVLPIRIKDV